MAVSGWLIAACVFGGLIMLAGLPMGIVGAIRVASDNTIKANAIPATCIPQSAPMFAAFTCRKWTRCFTATWPVAFDGPSGTAFANITSQKDGLTNIFKLVDDKPVGVGVTCYYDKTSPRAARWILPNNSSRDLAIAGWVLFIAGFLPYFFLIIFHCCKCKCRCNCFHRKHKASGALYTNNYAANTTATTTTTSTYGNKRDSMSSKSYSGSSDVEAIPMPVITTDGTPVVYPAPGSNHSSPASSPASSALSASSLTSDASNISDSGAGAGYEDEGAGAY